MLKRILVTAFLGGALVFTAPSAMANPHGKDRDRHHSYHRDGYHRDRDYRHHGGSYRKGYRRGYRNGYRDGYRDDYYYYGYNRPYYGRCYYRNGYRYYYDNGYYGSRYCDEYYYRHGYRSGYYPYGYESCDDDDWNAGYCWQG